MTTLTSPNTHTPATSSNGATAASRAVGDVERNTWIAVVALTSVLGVAGFVNSFALVEYRMRPYFGDLAWTVPLAIDVGILVFTALDLLMAYRDLRSVWLRFVPRALVAVTVYLNVAGETVWEGRVAHAVLPGIWVVAVEVAGTAVRTIFGLKGERARMDRIRRSRWLLAPLATARLRRRMILREETSYLDARARDLAFELAKADMRDRYGPLAWRWQAPRRERLLLRRGEVAPAAVETGPLAVPALPVGPVSGANGTGPDGAETADGTAVPDRRPRRRKTTRPGRSRTAVSEADLIAAAERIGDQMAADGVALARRSFIAAMRTAGYPVGTAKAAVLLDHLKTRTTDTEPSEPPGEDT
jgi:hypothetical protein